jgi:IS5 family transposase
MTNPFSPATRALIAEYRRPDSQERQRLDAAVAVLRDAVMSPEEAEQARWHGPELHWMPSANENRTASHELSDGLTESQSAVVRRETRR